MTSPKQIRYRRPLILLALYGGFFVFLFSTDPKKLPVGWLVLPFIWLFACLFLTVLYVIDWFTANHVHSRRQTLTAALLAAVLPVMLVLDSVDQLTLKDVLLIVVMALLGLFYVNKISLKRNRF